MSKTTVTLTAVLCVFIGILVYVIFNLKPTTLATITQFGTVTQKTNNTALSFSITEQSLRPGQTFTAAVLLHDPDAHISLAQLELAYDPTVLTVDSLVPGPFFVNPLIDLQNIDFSTGRISYALHCSSSQPTAKPANCTDLTAPTIAVVTFRISPNTAKSETTLSFLPKTVIRTSAGKNILQETTNLQIPITKPLYPFASSSAVFIHPTPAH